MRKIDNPKYSEFRDLYASCAAEAISYVFKLDPTGFLAISKALKMDIEGGMTTYQCRKVIDLLTKINKKTVTYTSNSGKFDLPTFLKLHKKGLFIINQCRHVSVLKDGLIVDKYAVEDFRIVGWWEIKPKHTARFKESTLSFARYIESLSIPS